MYVKTFDSMKIVKEKVTLLKREKSWVTIQILIWKIKNVSKK